MTQAPALFDNAVTRDRAQRRMRLGNGADFLFARAADDLVDRLQPILRPFPLMLDLGTANGAFYDQLKVMRPESRLVRAAPVLAGSQTDDLVCHIEAQPFGAESFDLITSGLALQHANDLPGALVQIRRALKPDGLFIGCLAGGATLTELRQSFAAAESEMTGGISPRVFPFADVRDMGSLLQRAGFTLSLSVTGSVKPALCKRLPMSRTSAKGKTRGLMPPVISLSAAAKLWRSSVKVAPPARQPMNNPSGLSARQIGRAHV